MSNNFRNSEKDKVDVHRPILCFMPLRLRMTSAQPLLCFWISILVVLMIRPTAVPAKDKKPHVADTSQTESATRQKRLEGIIVERLLVETNTARLRQGLEPLAPKKKLSEIAMIHSRNMCTAGELRHESDKYPPGWRTFVDRMRRIGWASGAENLAFRTYAGNPTDWARTVVTGWLNSPQHRKNLLDPTFRYVGIGVFLCKNGVAFATQVFSSQALPTSINPPQ